MASADVVMKARRDKVKRNSASHFPGCICEKNILSWCLTKAERLSAERLLGGLSQWKQWKLLGSLICLRG